MTRVKLREIEKKDLTLINHWRNDKDVIDYLGSNFIFIAPVIDEKWYENYLLNRDKAVRVAIIDWATNTHIGNTNLTSIHPINRTAEFSIFIGNKDYLSKGYGFEATMLLLRHGFRDLNLNRIYLTVLKNNIRAIRAYLKAGFEEEGIQREAVFKDGSYVDVVCMSVLKRNFNE